MNWYDILGSIARLCSAEWIHEQSLFLLSKGFVPSVTVFEDSCLNVDCLGQTFKNPIGLAAGFDKNAIAMSGFLNMGFGFVEVGTVTPKPQAGNPKPRLFRLKAHEAIINRMGFNNLGIDIVAKNLESFRNMYTDACVGLNIGKNKDTIDAPEDYAACVLKGAAYASYIVANVSSPNTPGLRALQNKRDLTDILTAIRTALTTLNLGRHIPIVFKVAPDLEPQDIVDISEVVLEQGIDALIVSNTTISREGITLPVESGGLSGRPLLHRSTQVLQQFYRETQKKITLIGVGGISSGADAYLKIKSGASLLQLYSALVYRGPYVVNQIKQDLVKCMRQDGFTKITQAIGADVS